MSDQDLDKFGEGVREAVWRCLAKKQHVACHTRLYHDLYISGDDASELLEELSQRFNTDFTGFQFEQYFPEEGDSLFAQYGVSLGLSKSKHRELTIGHLAAVVRSGSWFEPQGIPYDHHSDDPEQWKTRVFWFALVWSCVIGGAIGSATLR